MEEFIRGSSSYTRIRMQVCFKVKYCHPVFRKWGFRARCEEIFRGAAKDLGVVITEIGFDYDHVHMTWQIQVVHRIDHLAKVFKGRSAKKLLREFPEIKKGYF